MYLLKVWRKETGLSQEMMSKYVGIPYRTWCNWETGVRKPPAVAFRLFELLRQLEQIDPDFIPSRLNRLSKS